MNVIKDTIRVEITLKKEDFMFEGYVPATVVSAKLKKMEEEKGLKHKAYRYRLYNSLHSEKLNTKTMGGMVLINTKEPMKSKASIELVFKEE